MARFGSVLVTAALLGFRAESATFDLFTSFSFEAGLTAAEEASAMALYDDAAAFWTSRVTGYAVSDPHLQGIRIPAHFVTVDGPGGNEAFTVDKLIYPASGTSNGLSYSSLQEIYFDIDDTRTMLDRPDFFETAVHEIGHALGLGFRWIDNGFVVRGSGIYTGPQALAKYRTEFDPAATHIPVQLNAGPGADDLHWAESWAGGPFEIMTGGSWDLPPFLSATTLFSLRDLGYTTVSSPVAPIPLPPSVAMLGGAIAVVTLWHRRRPAREPRAS